MIKKQTVWHGMALETIIFYSNSKDAVSSRYSDIKVIGIGK